MTTAAYSPVASDPIGALIVNVQYGPDDLGHATVVLTRKQMLFGTFLIWVQPFVLTLVAVLPLFEGETVPWYAFLFWFYGAVLAFSVLLVRNTCMRVGRRAWNGRVFIKDPGQFVLTPDYVEQRFPLVQGRYAWKCFLGATETRTHLFLIFEGPSTMILPKRCFDGSEQIEQCRQVVRRGIAAEKPVKLWFEN